MRGAIRRWTAVLLLLGGCAVLDGAGASAQTQQPTLCCSGDFHIGPSSGQVVGALIGAGAVIGTGTYFLARAPRRSGCVESDGGVLYLREASGGGPGYVLDGATSALTPGRRVKVIGRKHRVQGHREVLKVSRVVKDYGACGAKLAAEAP